MIPPGPARRGVLLAVVAVVLVACSSGPGPGGVVQWRELTIDLPDGWVEIDRTSTSLTVADAPRPDDTGERGELEVATQFTVEPGASAGAWRRFVTDQDGTLEDDRSTTVGDLPATVLQFTFVTNGTPTRERIVVVPGRQLVLLQQPVPMQGETGGPEWFDRHLAEFDALLDGIRFGAPEGYFDDD